MGEKNYILYSDTASNKETTCNYHGNSIIKSLALCYHIVQPTGSDISTTQQLNLVVKDNLANAISSSSSPSQIIARTKYSWSSLINPTEVASAIQNIESTPNSVTATIPNSIMLCNE